LYVVNCYTINLIIYRSLQSLVHSQYSVIIIMIKCYQLKCFDHSYMLHSTWLYAFHSFSSIYLNLLQFISIYSNLSQLMQCWTFFIIKWISSFLIRLSSQAHLSFELSFSENSLHIRCWMYLNQCNYSRKKTSYFQLISDVHFIV